MDNIELIISKIDGLEENIKDHFALCNQNCTSKIDFVESVAEKAHARLDRQKESIECLNAHKNTEKGFRNAISLGMAVMTLIVAYLGLR